MEKDSIVKNRKYNQRNKMLNIIRFQENVSRYDLKKCTSYSMTTVLSMVEELIAEGYVYEEECEEVRVGRRPVWLRLNPDGGYFIGIEFNGYKMHCDILNFLGDVIYQQVVEMSRDNEPDVIINKVVACIDEAKRYLGEAGNKVLGVGIGVPGYVDKKLGIGRGYTYFKNWDCVHIKDEVEARVDLPCYIENNVNVMAFAYKWFLFNGDGEDFMFVSIRTGARVVPFINNRLIFSQTGFSGELGHIKVGRRHNICTCGKFGCLNAEISDVAIISKIREGFRLGRFQEIREMVDDELDVVDMEIFAKSVKAGHKDTLMLMEETAQYLGEALAVTINILSPKRIILYGELAKLGNVFLKELRIHIENCTIEENIEGLSIQASELGGDLGAIGAGALVMQEQFEFIDQII